jgi:MFS family permease
MQHLLGTALGPIFIGVLSDRYGLAPAMRWLPLFALLGSVLFLLGSRSYTRDLAVVEQATAELEPVLPATA